MDSTSGPAEPGASRPKRPLPSSTALSLTEREQTLSTASPDLGGTLVSQATDELGELSTDSDDEDATGTPSSTKRRKGKSKSNLPRRQIKIEYIQDKSRRNITFGKRKNGIFKKAQEISTLTGCEVMLIVAPKDSELQAYTYATTKLQPLVTDPAGEAYIQNCLRYGMLMPGTPSGMTGPYGPNAANSQGSHISILRTGPRASPASNHTTAVNNSAYSYVHNTGLLRRQASYGMPHPNLSSPQSSGPPNAASRNPQSVNLPDQSKRETSGSPIQQLGPVHSSRPPKQQWPPTSATTIGDFHATNPFQVSSPLGTAPMSARGLASFPMVTPTPGDGLCYQNMPSENAPFHRQSPDSSMSNSATWHPMNNGDHNLRTMSSTSGHPVNNGALGNGGTGFLEPLVLSQPYEHRSISSGDGPLSAGLSQPTLSHQVNIQSSLSQYGESESYEPTGPTSAYLHDGASEHESKPYVVGSLSHNQSRGLKLYGYFLPFKLSSIVLSHSPAIIYCVLDVYLFILYCSNHGFRFNKSVSFVLSVIQNICTTLFSAFVPPFSSGVIAASATSICALKTIL